MHAELLSLEPCAQIIAPSAGIAGKALMLGSPHPLAFCLPTFLQTDGFEQSHDKCLHVNKSKLISEIGRHAGTCILFGDGAGAVVLTSHDGPCALLGSDMSSDGSGYCNLNCPASSSSAGKVLDAALRPEQSSFANIHMNGQEVFKFAVRAVPKTLNASLAEAGLSGSKLEWLIMHQANQRILDAVAKKLGIPGDKVVSNLGEYGNTSAASIPIALDEAVRGGKVQSGNVVGMAGFGAGLTWASAVVRWL
jgi:3-oxoacyl-[acyl-carrier-protein] synthase-3